MSAKEILLRLFALTQRKRKHLIQAILFVIIATIADVCTPILIKHFIDHYVLHDSFPQQALAILGAAYLSLYIIAAGSNYAQSVRFYWVALSAIEILRNTAFSALLKHPLSYFDQHPTGQITSRLTNDTEAIKDLYVNILGTVTANSTRIIGIIIAMAFLDWRLMLPCLFMVPAVITIMTVYNVRSSPRVKAVRRFLGDINARLSESIQGIRVIQLFSQAAHFEHEFATVSNQHYQARLSNLKLDALLLRPLIDMLQTFTLASIVVYFGSRSLSTGASVGIIYVFINYLGRFVEPMIEITQRLNIFQQALVSGERIFTLIDASKNSHDTEQPIHFLRPTDNSLNIENLAFSYDGKVKVLKAISLAVESGKFLAIVGHTGSGKSTLASLILRLYEPDSGLITLGKVPLNQIELTEFHKRVVFVQQDPFLFASNIADNIAFGDRFSLQQITQAAKMAGLDAFIQTLPEGYNTMLGERGVNLSTGQRQLLALSRALIRTPSILVLDEATANIDSHSEQAIQQALLSLRGKLTLIVIAHRLSTVVAADNIIVLHKGEISETGSHDALLEADGLYRHLYELQTLRS